jgi:hypothetical protein
MVLTVLMTLEFKHTLPVVGPLSKIELVLGPIVDPKITVPLVRRLILPVRPGRFTPNPSRKDLLPDPLHSRSRPFYGHLVGPLCATFIIGIC